MVTPGVFTRLITRAADLYPYLILTACITDPDLYNGRTPGDVAQRGPVHLCAGVDPGQPGDEYRRTRPSEPVRRRRVRKGRAARCHGVPGAYPVVLPHAGHDRRRHECGPGRFALRQAAGIRRRNSTAITSRPWCALPPCQATGASSNGPGASATHTWRKSCPETTGCPAATGISAAIAGTAACG